jgi:hypothetical protein
MGGARESRRRVASERTSLQVVNGHQPQQPSTRSKPQAHSIMCILPHGFRQSFLCNVSRIYSCLMARFACPVLLHKPAVGPQTTRATRGTFALQ